MNELNQMPKSMLKALIELLNTGYISDIIIQTINPRRQQSIKNFYTEAIFNMLNNGNIYSVGIVLNGVEFIEEDITLDRVLKYAVTKNYISIVAKPYESHPQYPAPVEARMYFNKYTKDINKLSVKSEELIKTLYELCKSGRLYPVALELHDGPNVDSIFVRVLNCKDYETLINKVRHSIGVQRLFFMKPNKQSVQINLDKYYAYKVNDKSITFFGNPPDNKHKILRFRVER